MIALLGYGKTSRALLKYFNDLNQKCLVFDDSFKHIKSDDFGNQFLPSDQKMLGDARFEIPSPGIPPYHPLIRNSSNLVSDYDLLLDEKKKQIWISGTNGKTTTTEMLEWILRDFGAKSGGNIGLPLVELCQIKPKIWILETSSFTLHYTQKAFPQIYLLLPIGEDHISWHGSFESYLQAKLSPIVRMHSDCVAIIPQELMLRDEVRSSKAQMISYQTSQDLAQYFGLKEDLLCWNDPFLLDALLALGGAKALCAEDLTSKLLDFTIGRHKLEEFKDNRGRIWIDDSKGTNIDATIWAVRTYKKHLIFLILGGDDKGADLTPLFEELQRYRIEIFGIGSNVEKLKGLAQRFSIPFVPCFELEIAIKWINEKHSAQSIAMLSPAASSLDQFQSYKHRGERFQECVRLLK